MDVTIIPVVCAIIERGDEVLCAQRSANMSLPLKWEFPGGKLECNESAEEALIREIEEELGVRVEIEMALPYSDHHYVPEKCIRLIPFVCSIAPDANPGAREHAELRWVAKNQLLELDWAAADVPIVLNYLNKL